MPYFSVRVTITPKGRALSFANVSMVSQEMVPHNSVPIEFRYKLTALKIPTYHRPDRLPLTLLYL
jgi:hypothetical protein